MAIQRMAIQRAEVRGMTYDDYCLLPDDRNRYEVIEGELTMSPSPRYRHQDTVWRLGVLLHTFVETNKLGAVVGAPMDVILEPNTIVQPDLLFIRRENMEIITELNIQGPPDLCIEVLSPNTGLHDRYTKKAVYARCGVPEYWIIDPAREIVSVFEIDGDTYRLRGDASGDDVVSSGVLAGFQIIARSVFA
ncbi:MAG: Uma2 family endonuclease [Chloroflexota bacterium]|nr:Uma2 family endonuclease [Chloroflexota bacterium]